MTMMKKLKRQTKKFGQTEKPFCFVKFFKKKFHELKIVISYKQLKH